MSLAIVTRHTFCDGERVRSQEWRGTLNKVGTTGAIVVDGSWFHIGRFAWANGRIVQETSYQVEGEK